MIRDLLATVEGIGDVYYGYAPGFVTTVAGLTLNRPITEHGFNYIVFQLGDLTRQDNNIDFNQEFNFMLSHGDWIPDDLVDATLNKLYDNWLFLVRGTGVSMSYVRQANSTISVETASWTCTTPLKSDWPRKLVGRQQ